MRLMPISVNVFAEISASIHTTVTFPIRHVSRSKTNRLHLIFANITSEYGVKQGINREVRFKI